MSFEAAAKRILEREARTLIHTDETVVARAYLETTEALRDAVGWAETEEYALGHSLAWADAARRVLAEHDKETP